VGFEILKLGNPHAFILIKSRQVPRIYVRKVEMKIHNDLSEFSLGREWFRIAP
jgi:hypothetical protein